MGRFADLPPPFGGSAPLGLSNPFLSLAAWVVRRWLRLISKFGSLHPSRRSASPLYSVRHRPRRRRGLEGRRADPFVGGAWGAQGGGGGTLPHLPGPHNLPPISRKARGVPPPMVLMQGLEERPLNLPPLSPLCWNPFMWRAIDVNSDSDFVAVCQMFCT